MKTVSLLSTLLLGVSLSAPAAIVYDSPYQNGGVIPDDTTVWQNNATVSGFAPVISSVTVTLNLSGGWNGDLYAYLSYNNTKLVLLNRVGVGTGSDPTFSFGFSGAGYSSLLLSDSGSGNVHDYNGVGPATRLADGRDISPESDPATLYAASQATFGSTFGGMNPNGTWTLVFADMSGGAQSTLTSWALDIEAVPEPVNVALGVFGMLFAGVAVARRLRARGQAAS